jgi:hypothetical protein
MSRRTLARWGRLDSTDSMRAQSHRIRRHAASGASNPGIMAGDFPPVLHRTGPEPHPGACLRHHPGTSQAHRAPGVAGHGIGRSTRASGAIMKCSTEHAGMPATFTVTTSIIRVLPVSRSIAPWMFKRWRPLVCSIATGVSFGAQHPTGRTVCAGCASAFRWRQPSRPKRKTASANSTASPSPI